MTQAVGVILAGGQARRMGGGDKGRLLLEKKSLFQHVINRLAPQVDRIVLNANGNPDRFKDLSLPVIADNFGDHAGLWPEFWPGWIGPNSMACIISLRWLPTRHFFQRGWLKPCFMPAKGKSISWFWPPRNMAKANPSAIPLLDYGR